MNAARGYYETAFRRYTRALGVIKARKVEKTELLGLTIGEVGKEGYKAVYERLKYSNVDVDGEGGAILAYMADNKELVSPPQTSRGAETDNRFYRSKLFSDPSAWFYSITPLQNSLS